MINFCKEKLSTSVQKTHRLSLFWDGFNILQPLFLMAASFFADAVLLWAIALRVFWRGALNNFSSPAPVHGRCFKLPPQLAQMLVLPASGFVHWPASNDAPLIFKPVACV